MKNSNNCDEASEALDAVITKEGKESSTMDVGCSILAKNFNINAIAHILPRKLRRTEIQPSLELQQTCKTDW
ncbi:hypothetical protein DMENIID0001_055240 [Sergentomyia squamirostris]